MENNSKSPEEVNTVDRECSETKLRKEKNKEKDNGNHGQPQP